MTFQSELQQILRSKTLIKRAALGAALAFVLICVFILGTLTMNARLGNWVIFPILGVTAGGVFGGIFYHLMDLFRIHGGWKKVLAEVASVLAYFIILYMSLILVLNATGEWS